MKKIIALTAPFLILVGCNSNEVPDTNVLIEQKNVEGLRARQAELVNQNNLLKQELNKVMAAIDRLDKDKKKSLVTVLQLKETNFVHTVMLQGIVKTDQNMLLNAEYAGAVKKIHVKEGQKVNKGDLLMTLDDGGLAQNLALQKVQLDLAKTLYERQERLWEQNIGAEIDYLQVKAAYESQKKTYQQLKQQLKKSALYAPFSGRVDDIVVEVGELVSPGVSPLLRLINLSNMYVEADVPEAYFPSISERTTATIEIPVFDYSFTSRVTHKGTHINTGNRTFRVSLATNNAKNLAPNLITTVQLVDYQNPKAIVVPLDVISENFDGAQYVYVVNSDEKAEKRFVQTGLVEGAYVEILKGLRVSDRVIDEGARLVKENENVQVTNSL
jgi:RND family efflux transporter MFP subunit